MKTAIIFATKHGTTEKVAKKIAERLGNQVSLINLKGNKHPDINLYEGIILGTPVYVGQSSKAMRIFAKNHTDALATKRVGLFVCGMELNVERQKQELEHAYPPQLLEHAVAKHFLGGEFSFEKMNFFELAIIKRIAKTDKNVSQIKEEEIEKLVAEFSTVNK
jgi:menaquinone-dependent protoporphyrinogen oxidase